MIRFLQNADFPRLANWMILQATLALPLYIGLGLVAVAKYYQAQNDRPILQQESLIWAHRSLQVATWSYLPTKIVPAAFSLYWLAQSKLNLFDATPCLLSQALHVFDKRH